ncbi:MULTISPECIES: hypothetical protein [Methanobacterium]|uniref:Phage tail sheath protein n=1 Tax=Methanobacterium bryantii TaxID=2161 RepID=A0A2A2H8P6_METBR|nr:MULTISPECIES: hypothetical protein [Methanobacterium]OEC87890.1 hypothetical protein A9507_06860 [Methanobacterium sp. A39]PAV05757.1 hypothetical protein ASJ80_08470 [Methanobacterium bryantii]
MVIYEPTITVQDVESTVTLGGGMAGVVVIIGAFPYVDSTIKSYTSSRKALEELKGGVTTIPEGALGYHALEYLFRRDGNSLGIEELLVVNITSEVEEVLNYTLTADKLADALDLIKDEQFDILFVADVLDAALLANIKELRDDMYAAQLPWGLISAVTVETESDVTAINTLFKTGGAYKLITTPKQLEGDAEPLNRVNTAAWDVAYTAGQLVNASETGKIIPGVIGQGTKESLPDIYDTILENGLHSQKIINRRLGQVITNNIMTPTGRDMAIERVKDYIVGDLALRDIFGDPNINATYDFIRSMFEVRKQKYTDLRLISDMKYEITACDTKCVKAELELFIPDVITEIRLFVKVTPTSVEVSSQEA